ncbi:N-formylglutamate amidohydrolase [Roseivirga sp. BDSF3-8]|uniref:N-formylglutamate amidohydrolase n=1 Tax=Roseivirga sp. BDSF3-8 TaxID=3241598 RepID=UPI003531CA0F
MSSQVFELDYASYPLITFAIHDGHDIRPELAEKYNLSDKERLREEDPFTRAFTEVSPNRMVGSRSRFEVDLNRPPSKAVYLKPEDAWGLEVWKKKPTKKEIERSMKIYKAFYDHVHTLITTTIEQFGFALIYDIHSYNYKREGPRKEADPDENPEINLGTEFNDLAIWEPVVGSMAASIRKADYFGRSLDVRENVKFGGGYFPEWIYEHFGSRCLCISIEFKKIFMSEWKGKAHREKVERLKEILAGTVEPTLKAARIVAKQQEGWVKK